MYLYYANGEISEEIQKVLLDMTGLQLKEDENSNSPSLCAKWAPREKKGKDSRFNVIPVPISIISPQVGKFLDRGKLRIPLRAPAPSRRLHVPLGCRRG